MDFPAANDVYASKDEVAAYLRSYASTFDLPVRLNVRVTSLARSEHGYVVATKDEVFRATQVVVATGPIQAPFVPRMARDLDTAVAQVHSAQYRSPDQLPEGPVLVVGGGNSGFQIAAELARTRKVDHAVGYGPPPRGLSGPAMTQLPLDSEPGRGTASGPRQAHLAAVVWGLVVGRLQAGSQLVFWWLDAATVYAVGLVVIASIYIGFAVADGRRHMIVVESVVATVFVVIATAAITGSPWLLVLGSSGTG